MIKALIFDVGGVLVRTEDPSHRQRLAAEMGLSVPELCDVVFRSDTWKLAQVGRITNDEHWQAVGRRLNLTVRLSAHDEAWPDRVNAFRGAFFAGDQLDRDLLAFIRRLRGRHKLALLSNAPDGVRRWIDETWNIPADTFDEIIISAEVGVAKPDPTIYHIALERLDVAPHEVIFVDDSAENVEAARALSIQAIRFTSPEALMAKLSSWIDLPSER